MLCSQGTIAVFVLALLLSAGGAGCRQSQPSASHASESEKTAVLRESTGKRKRSSTDAPTRDGLGQMATAADGPEQTSDTVSRSR